DGEGGVEILAGGRFNLIRPRAVARCCFASDGRVDAVSARLDVPETYGVFPYAEVRSTDRLSSTVVTAVDISSTAADGGGGPGIRSEESGWLVEAVGGMIRVNTTGDLPDF